MIWRPGIRAEFFASTDGTSKTLKRLSKKYDASARTVMTICGFFD